VQDSLWRYYQARNPGEVQVLGADLFDGTSAQLTQFKNTTGATYPLLLCGACGTGNEDLFIPWGDRDSYAVINKQGICRYNAYDLWPYGNRFHLGELRGTVDSLVSAPTAVGHDVAPVDGRLDVSPNPFRAATTVTLTNPTREALPARVTVTDIGGRVVATLWDGPLARGVTRWSWAGGDAGGPAPPGVYLVRGRLGGVPFERRVVRLR
jgi:hypothetical protein